MKKQLLTLFTVVSSGLCFSQNTIHPSLLQQVNLNSIAVGNSALHPATNLSQNRAVSLWLDDFSNPTTWTLDNDGQTGTTFGWNINTTSESWFTGYDFPTGINSTSGGNFAEIQNGNYNNSDQATFVTYNITTSSPIDINTLTGGVNDVSLQFQQYGGLFNDSQIFQVSTDGTNWTTVGDNNSRTTFIGNNPAALYANPETVTVSISSAISSNPSSVWIRFSWTSRFPTDPGLNAWTTFGWYIDDVEIVQTPQNDLKMLQVYSNVDGNISKDLTYYSTPISQIQPWFFYSTYKNAGTQTQNGTSVSIDINSGLFNATSAPLTVPSSDTVFLDSALSSFTPPLVVASYDVTYSVSSLSVDENILDNIITETYEISEDVYSRDNGQIGGGYSLGTSYVSSGNLFEIFTAQKVKSIDFNIGNNSTVGAEVYPVIYEYDGAMWNTIYWGSSYYVTAQDLTNGIISLDVLADNFEIPVGTYLFSVGSYNNVVILNGTNSSSIGTSLVSDNGGTMYYTSQTPMVRVKLASCEEVLVLQNQPQANAPVFQSYGGYHKNFTCVGSCANEVYLNIQNGNYVEVYDENQNLIGSDSVGTFQSSYTEVITGTFCPGQTYAAVVKSRCDDNSAFIQISDTLFFDIDTTSADLTISAGNASGCGIADASVSINGFFNYHNVGFRNSYTINWSGPQSGTVSGLDSMMFNKPLGNNFLPGTYSGEFINNDLGCDPVPFIFIVGNNDNVEIDDLNFISSNTSNCNATDGYINIIATNPSGNNIDVSWSGPVSGSFTNIPPSSSGTNYINLPSLSNGSYQIIASVTGNPTCSSDTIYVDVVTSTISQEICVVTVDELTSSYNILVWEKPTSMQAIDSFYVYREITTNNYQKIAAIDGDDLSEYEDFAANPNATNYKYKITVLDSCGAEGDFGLYHNSIHLQYLGFGNFQWTPYEIESTSNQVGSYNFYRDDNGTGNFVLLQIIPGGNTTFTDVNYASFPNAIYRVDVNWTNGNNCTSTKANINTSRSNKKAQVAGSPNAVIEMLSNGTTLSPIPAKEEVFLKVPTSIKNANFRVLNGVGQVLFQSSINDEIITMNIANYAKGIYIVVIDTPYGSISKKLIKE